MSASPKKRPRLSIVITAILALVLGIPLAVFAAHQFDDVPDGHLFHADIDWLFSNGVTVGCNPSSGGNLYCPDLEVDRGQMAAFMHRLADTFGSDGSEVTDDSANVSINSETLTEVANVTVSPKDEAWVTLNGHVHIALASGVGEGNFEVVIARDSCSGTQVGAAGWVSAQADGETSTDTISVTGFDQATAETTYHLCVAQGDAASLDGTAVQRGLVANWNPGT